MRNFFVLVLVVVVLALPTTAIFAQSTGDGGATPAQLYNWAILGLSILAVLGVSIGAFLLGKFSGQGNEYKLLKEAILAARNDIPTMNKIEAGLVDVLKPGGVDMLNFGGNAFLNLVGVLLASSIDQDTLNAIKDYWQNQTDRKPNLPPESPAPVTVVSAVNAPPTLSGPSVTAEVR